VVNTGTLKELLGLHGIGKKRAEAIIENRPFAKVHHRPPASSVAAPNVVEGSDLTLLRSTYTHTHTHTHTTHSWPSSRRSGSAISSLSRS
jgi:hypothetical protein